MNALSIKRAKSNLSKIIDCCIKYDEVFNITTDMGNVILLSEKRYNKILELLSLYKDVREAVNTPSDKFERKSPFEINS